MQLADLVPLWQDRICILNTLIHHCLRGGWLAISVERKYCSPLSKRWRAAAIQERRHRGLHRLPAAKLISGGKAALQGSRRVGPELNKLEQAMKRRIIFLLASLTVAAMCLAQAGCGRRPAGENATSNNSASNPPGGDNANSNAQSASAGAPSTEPPPASSASQAETKSGEAKSPDSTASPTPAAELPPPPPRTYTLAAGRPISIYTTSALSTKTNKAGDSFVGTLASAIVDKDWVIARKGATVEGVISNSDPGGKVKGVASLTLVAKRMELADGRKIELATSSFTKQARTTKKKDAMKIGGGAGVGALIGALAGGKKGAAIGAGVGAGAGTGVVLATRGDPATIPGESQLTFRLRSPVTVTKR